MGGSGEGCEPGRPSPPKSLLLVKRAGASLVTAMCCRANDVAFVLLFWLYLFFSLPRL